MLLQVLAATTVLSALCLPSAERITSAWIGGLYANFAHSLPVLVGALWLFFQLPPAGPDRSTSARSATALTLILGCSAVWLIGGLVFLNAAQDLAFFVMFATTLTLIFRPAALGEAAKPILLLSVCLPDWKQLIPSLQDVTIHLSEHFLRVISMPVLIDGYLIKLPEATFRVAPACAGLRELLVGIAVAVVFSHFERFRWWVSICVAAGAAAVAVLMNGIRVAVVVTVGQAFGVGSDFVQNHNWAGLVAFGVGMCVYLPLAAYLVKRLRLEAPSDRAWSARRTLQWTAPVGAIVLAGTGPLVLAYLDNRAIDTTMTYTPVPSHLGDWSTAEPERNGWWPSFAGADVTQRLTYQHPSGRTIVAYIATYNRQQRGREAVFYENTPVSARGWRWQESTKLRNVDIGDTLDQVEETVVASRERKLYVWQWFESSSGMSGSRIEAKLRSILPTLGGDTSMRTIMIATPADDRTAAEAALQSFARAFAAESSGDM
jgi:EpsI family protein